VSYVDFGAKVQIIKILFEKKCDILVIFGTKIQIIGKIDKNTILVIFGAKIQILKLGKITTIIVIFRAKIQIWQKIIFVTFWRENIEKNQQNIFLTKNSNETFLSDFQTLLFYMPQREMQT